MGLVVSDLSPQQKKSLQLESGVYVHKVLEGTAKQSGIMADDVIMMVDGTKISNLGQLQELVQTLESGRSVAVLVHRSEGPSFIAIKIP